MKSCNQDALEYMDYLEAAVWTEELEQYELSQQAIEKAKLEWYDFYEKAKDLIEGMPLKSIAHDFHLTRNGHGEGFSTSEYLSTEMSNHLTSIACSFGSCMAFLGDDNLIYLE